MSLNEKTMHKNNMLEMSTPTEKVAVPVETANRIALTFAIVIPIAISAIGLSAIIPQLF